MDLKSLVNEVKRLKTKCIESQWADFRKLADDKDTDRDYGRMLRLIMDKADEEDQHTLCPRCQGPMIDKSKPDGTNNRSAIGGDDNEDTNIDEGRDVDHLKSRSKKRKISEIDRGDDSFRKEVLDELRRPFDKEELKRYQEADEVYYKTFPGLESILNKCRYEKGKWLNIFRGFFFWLRNVAREGAFQPWRDEECLAVEPAPPVLAQTLQSQR